MQLHQLQVLFASDMEPHKQEQLKKGAALGRYMWHRIPSCVLMLVGWRTETQCKYGPARMPHGLFSTTIPQLKFDGLTIPTSALMLTLELRAMARGCKFGTAVKLLIPTCSSSFQIVELGRSGGLCTWTCVWTQPAQREVKSFFGLAGGHLGIPAWCCRLGSFVLFVKRNLWVTTCPGSWETTSMKRALKPGLVVLTRTTTGVCNMAIHTTPAIWGHTTSVTRLQSTHSWI